MAKLFSLMGEIYLETTKAEAAMKQTKDKAVDLSKTLEKIGKSTTDLGKKMTLSLTAPIAGIVGLGVNYNSQIEQYQAGLETMLGSADKATSMLKDLKTMASKTPFETTDLIKASQTMLAFGVDADKTKGYLQMLGDVSMGNKEKLDSLTLAFSQVQSTGKLMGQDLLQMVNQGFNPLQIISEQTGESMASLKDKMSKGAISADMVTEAFKIATSEGGRFYGSMDSQSQTFSGKMSTLKDDFMTMVGTLTESLLPTFKILVDKVSEAVSWFSSLDGGTQQMILQTGLFVAALGPLLTVVGNIITLVGTLSKALSILLAHPIIALITLTVVAVGVAVYQIVKNWDTVKLILNAMWNTIKDIFSKIGNFIDNIFKGIVNTIIWAVNRAIELINNMIKLALTPLNLLIKGLNKIPGVDIPTLKIEIPKIPKLAKGLSYVPYDEFPAILHKGERVLTAKENNDYNKGTGNYFHIENLNVRDDKDIERIAEELYYLQKRSVA